MKKVKTISSLFLAVLFLALSIPYINVSATELRYGKTVLSKMKNSDALIFVYDCLVSGCDQAAQEIKTEHSKYKINSDELSVVYQIFHADYPEYFWVKNGYSLSEVESTKSVVSVFPEYNDFINGNLKDAKTAFENKVNQIIQGLNGKSDYEKSLILHDRLANNTDYIFTKNDQNAYGALVEGKAVCAGYSKAYQYLLQKVGIPAWCVIGESNNPITGNKEPHEWNLVSLDGKWYYTDVTWDDQGDYLFYAYLNITTNQMKENHTVTKFQEYLPNATTTDANYFVKNNLIYSNLDLDRIVKNLIKLNDFNYETRICVIGNPQTFLNSLYDNLNQITQKMGVPANYGCSCSGLIIGNEIDLSISIIDPDHKHSLTYIQAKAASCTSKGSIAYYTCSCGKWFSDANAQNEITNKQNIYTNAVAHTPSKFKTDSMNHWKICTQCGKEVANSSASHTDNDNNCKCDTCGYSLPKKQVISTPKPDTTTQSGSTDTQSVTSQNDVSGENNSTEDTSFEPQDTTVAEPKPKKKIPVLPIAIGGGTVAIISAGIGIFFIVKHK